MSGYPPFDPSSPFDLSDQDDGDSDPAPAQTVHKVVGSASPPSTKPQTPTTPKSAWYGFSPTITPTLPTQQPLPIQKNLNPYGGLIYPYEVDSLIYDPVETNDEDPKVVYKVTRMRACRDASSGGYEIQIQEVVPGRGPNDIFWYPASYFFPCKSKKQVSSKDPYYPHQCPRCGGPAYYGLGYFKTDCKNKCH